MRRRMGGSWPRLVGPLVFSALLGVSGCSSPKSLGLAPKQEPPSAEQTAENRRISTTPDPEAVGATTMFAATGPKKSSWFSLHRSQPVAAEDEPLQDQATQQQSSTVPFEQSCVPAVWTRAGGGHHQACGDGSPRCRGARRSRRSPWLNHFVRFPAGCRSAVTNQRRRTVRPSPTRLRAVRRRSHNSRTRTSSRPSTATWMRVRRVRRWPKTRWARRP